MSRRILPWLLPLALLMAACGGATPPPPGTPTAAASHITPSASEASLSQQGMALSAQQVEALVRQTYPAGRWFSSCERPGRQVDLSQCPFTAALRSRVEAFYTNRTGAGFDVMCHCQDALPGPSYGPITLTAHGGSEPVTTGTGRDAQIFTVYVVAAPAGPAVTAISYSAVSSLTGRTCTEAITDSSC